MTAKLYALPLGERNSQLVMARRRVILARPDVRAQCDELEEMLTARHVNKLLANADDVPCDRRWNRR